MLSIASPHALPHYRKLVAWASLILAIILVMGWAIAIVVSWPHIISSHARLGYLIGDVGLVVPLCLAAWFGLPRNKPWAPLLFLVLDGALAYDVVHFGIYLIQEQFLSIPTPIYIVVLIGCLVLLYWLAKREMTTLLASP